MRIWSICIISVFLSSLFYAICYLTLEIKSAKVKSRRKSRGGFGGRKELIMTMRTVSGMNTLSVVGSSFFSFSKARFFAGLFCRAEKPILSDS